MAKKQKTDPFILSIRRRQRDSITRAWDLSQEVAKKQARDALYRSVSSVAPSLDMHRRQDAIVYAVSKLASAVINSMGINVPISVRSHFSKTQAATNFKSIHVRINPTPYNIDDLDQMGRFVQFVKGLLYHEAGHIQYSVPFQTLWNAAGSTDKGAAVLDKLLSEAQEKHYINFDNVRNAWNVLEDQRMECAMVRMSPIMRAYFTVIVLDYVVSKPEAAWPWVAGRTYLSADILHLFRKFTKEHWSPLIPNLATRVNSVMARYKRSTDPLEMAKCCVEYACILAEMRMHTSLPTNFDDHEPSPGEDNMENYIERLRETQDDGEQPEDEQPEGNGKPVTDKDDADDESETDGAGTDDDDDDDDDDESENEASGAGDDESEDDEPTSSSPTKPSDGLGTQPDDNESVSKQDLSDAVNEAIKEAVDHPENKESTKDFVSSINEELGNTLPHNPNVAPLSDADLKDAEEVHNGMMRTLEPLAVQADPAWHYRREQGIIDPTAYRLREPGDTDFWIDKDDTGATGFDLAVSVILDVSGSMISRVRSVGIAAYGIRKACDELSIPCTVTTFHSHSNMLWAGDEPVTPVFATATGNTVPIDALTALRDQQYGKSRHLVVVLTDGIWGDDYTLPQFAEPGRYFLVVGIGVDMAYLNKLGADMVVAAGAVSQLPDLVTNALIGYLV